MNNDASYDDDMSVVDDQIVSVNICQPAEPYRAVLVSADMNGDGPTAAGEVEVTQVRFVGIQATVYRSEVGDRVEYEGLVFDPEYPELLHRRDYYQQVVYGPVAMPADWWAAHIEGARKVIGDRLASWLRRQKKGGDGLL